MKKNTVTGLMNNQHEVQRLQNLFYKDFNSASYFKNFGLDWDFFNDEKIEISIASFLSYFTQEATKNGIIIIDIKSKLKDFILTLTITLLNEDTVYLNTTI